MQTLLNAKQMRLADLNAIGNKFIDSIDLMENAAQAFVERFICYEQNLDDCICVFCGKGNNGGDGLAIARLLYQRSYKNISVVVINFIGSSTLDYLVNYKQIEILPINIHIYEKGDEFEFKFPEIIIDAILGTGLNRKISEELKKVFQFINESKSKIYAVDIPSGMESDGLIELPYCGVNALRTITFQRPKISFLFPESRFATQYFDVVEIGLDEQFIQSQSSPFSLITDADVKGIIKVRLPFSHKGSYGHVLVVAGNVNTIGAAILTASSSLNAGAGLVTASIPIEGLSALNSKWPEVMFLPRVALNNHINAQNYKVIAIGPGLGTGRAEENIFKFLLSSNLPMVVDADALNILANNLNWLHELPVNSILTPHVKEFDRLFGNHNNWYERIETAIGKAKEFNVVILLKNQYTFIVLPDGRVLINSTGNPAMAQGGMGDVLTGIISSFLAQGYTSEEACVLGVFLHGSIGDRLSDEYYVISAGKIVDELSREIKNYLKKK